MDQRNIGLYDDYAHVDLDRAATIANFTAAVANLEGRRRSNGRAGCVGFRWVGAMSNQLAVHSPDLAAAVVYYGRSPAEEQEGRIKARLLLNHAELDRRINSGVPPYKAALKKAGVRYTLHMDEGANHAFNTDTRPARYNEAAAKLAWRSTVAFFKDSLGG